MGLPSTPATALPMIGLSWLAVETTSSLPPLLTSHAQPLPKRVMPAFSNFSLNASKWGSSASLGYGRGGSSYAIIIPELVVFQSASALFGTFTGSNRNQHRTVAQAGIGEQ